MTPNAGIDPSSVIELHDVTKRFATAGRAVDALVGLTATIEAGRITGLVGPDGAGKTTLMRLLTGLLKADSGAVNVLGFDVAVQAQRVQSAIGYMPQRFGLYEDLSVAENLSLYADLQGLTDAAQRRRFEDLIAFTGLGPFRSRLAGRLSGGMKQKLGLACTLVRPPPLLLLDEPSVGVDPVSRRELWDIVNSLVGEGMSVLWATAYLDEAERCDDFLLLSEGRLLAAGRPRDFAQGVRGRTFAVRPANPDRRAVLQEIRRLPHVIDAIIKGHEIRVLVSRQADADHLSQCCRDLKAGEAAVEAVEPLFEDAFLSLLKEPDEGMAGPTSVTSDTVELLDHGTAAVARAVASRSAIPPKSDDETDRRDVVIEVAGLVRKFGDFTAVDRIDFTVRRGEIFGLLGPNGAGKSTTFKMLCGLLPPTDGKALVLGIDLRRAAAIARGHIGYMAQKFSLYGNMSTLQNLQFFASAYGLSGRRLRDKIQVELREFGLGPYEDVASEFLPLGYRQRLALACAIMHEPGILFLDEPTSGVDPLVRREFWTRINAMAEVGVTVMVTTHFMEEAEYCDRIGVIYRGRLVAVGTPDDLKEEHRSRELPEPTLEDAFIDLIKSYDQEHAV